MTNWKNEYCSRYKGRGNSWIVIPYTSPASKMIQKKLISFSEKGIDTSKYKKDCDKQSFYWIRYHKVIGTKDHPFVAFEIRVNGSKVDHKNNLITIPAKISTKFDLLGNTPHKLKLENEDSVKVDLKQKNKKENLKSKNEDDSFEKVTFSERVLDSMSFVEGSIKPLINFKLPGIEDNNTFKAFLIYENAIKDNK